MTHEPEWSFSAVVGQWLEGQFPRADITKQQQLASGRIPDYVVELDGFHIAVEVENDWEGAIGGVGQAVLYAAHMENTMPMVVVPEGHVEFPEAALLKQRTGVMVVEVDDGGNY